MANQQEIIRSSMNSLVKNEKNSDMFKRKLGAILKIPMSQDMKQKLSRSGIPVRNGDLADAMTGAMVLQALTGNIAAYTTIRDTMGYKPVENVRNDVVVRIDMSPRARELGE